jgi:hypothetical protein
VRQEPSAILLALSCLPGAAVPAAVSKPAESRERSYAIRPVGAVEIEGDETYLRIGGQHLDGLKGLGCVARGELRRRP